MNSGSATSHLSAFPPRGRTFPNKDFPVGAVVQDEAVVPEQQLLPKRTLSAHFAHRHGTRGVGHLKGSEGHAFRTGLPVGGRDLEGLTL